MRLDELLVQRGLCADLHEAQACVIAGEVVVGEHRAASAGMNVKSDVPVRLKSGKQRGGFVSRGGLKLQHALDTFDLDVTGLSCVDLGASSGGFTDCLLQRGAAHVSAVDVGVRQFEARREDVGEGGVVCDAHVHASCIQSVFESVCARGFEVCALTYSPVKGPAGNIEFLFWAKFRGITSRQEGSMCFDEIERVVAGAHAKLKGDS